METLDNMAQCSELFLDHCAAEILKLPSAHPGLFVRSNIRCVKSTKRCLKRPAAREWIAFRPSVFALLSGIGMTVSTAGGVENILTILNISRENE